VRLSRLSPSATTPLLYEPFTNHNDGTNILFADGHVVWLAKASALPVIAQAKANAATAAQPPATRRGDPTR
jgi:prepilin-type processing-associated H-X9-DG protein